MPASTAVTIPPNHHPKLIPASMRSPTRWKSQPIPANVAARSGAVRRNEETASKPRCCLVEANGASSGAGVAASMCASAGPRRIHRSISIQSRRSAPAVPSATMRLEPKRRRTASATTARHP
jgi:hypothetical protein